MVIEISRDTPEKKVKSILRNRRKKKNAKNALEDFFGKLPEIEDGLTFQKKVRREWK